MLRQTISKRFYSAYPILVFNVGFHKLIIQNTLGGGQQYLYHLDDDEEFMNFVYFTKNIDVGLNSSCDVNIIPPGSSMLAFITKNSKT